MDRAMSGESPQILVVDDEPRAVELLTRTLRKQARVATAHSGDEAWEIFQHGDFSVVIADHRMPGMSGVDLLGRIADSDDLVGRILLTGYSDLDATVAAINRGRVHAYLHKPCSPPDLQATVRGVVARVELARENARLLSELKQAAASLDRAQARAVASERLAAVGKMTAMIVHDLRGPLSVLGSIAGEIDSGATSRSDGELEGIAAALREEVGGLNRMCQALLEETQLGETDGRRAREALDEVVATALAFAMETASAQGVRVELDLASRVELEVDEAALRRALRNLASNALEAMPEGGTLRVSTATEGAEVVVRISDTGVGIPDEIADRLFEPFITAGKQGGTGLGLAVVQKVVDDHDGAIEVSKPEGGGTCFALRLPHGAGT